MDYKERCKYLEERIKHLNLIGMALSTEENLNKLFEMIMNLAFKEYFSIIKTFKDWK